MDIKKRIAQGLADAFVDSIDDDRKVEKTIPMKPEWAKLWKQTVKAKDEAFVAEQKMKAKRKKFWGIVEDGLEIYDRSMSVSEDGLEIKIYALED